MMQLFISREKKNEKYIRVENNITSTSQWLLYRSDCFLIIIIWFARDERKNAIKLIWDQTIFFSGYMRGTWWILIVLFSSWGREKYYNGYNGYCLRVSFDVVFSSQNSFDFVFFTRYYYLATIVFCVYYVFGVVINDCFLMFYYITTQFRVHRIRSFDY